MLLFLFSCTMNENSHSMGAKGKQLFQTGKVVSQESKRKWQEKDVEGEINIAECRQLLGREDEVTGGAKRSCEEAERVSILVTRILIQDICKGPERPVR